MSIEKGSYRSPGHEMYLTDAIKRLRLNYFNRPYEKFAEIFGSIEQFFADEIHVKANKSIRDFYEDLRVALQLAEEKGNLDPSWLEIKASLDERLG